jgi:thiol-disulfide isomerase/thioredoxin
MKYLLIATISVLTSALSYGQNVFQLRLVFKDKELKAKTTITLDNGKESKSIGLDTIKEPIIFIDTFNTNYGHFYLEINSVNPITKSFFFDSRNASIEINNPTSKARSELSIKVLHCYTEDELGARDYKIKTNFAEQEMLAFAKVNIPKFGSDTAIFNEFNNRMNKVFSLQADYIKNNGDKYYSLWLFRNRLLNAPDVFSRNRLLTLFENSFNTTIKNSAEGRSILEKINEGRLYKTEVFPSFEAKTIQNSSYSNLILSGKYFLVICWATWCVPCVNELPILANLNKKVLIHPVNFLFFSQDKSQIILEAGINKYQLSYGQHFMTTDKLIRHFKAQSIPQIYLVDNKGIILYSREQENDNDLSILSKIFEQFSLK